MKTYLFNFEFDYIAVNAETIEDALNLAISCIDEDTVRNIEYIKESCKKYLVAEGYSAEYKASFEKNEIASIEYHLEQKEKKIAEIYKIIPTIVESNTAVLISHGNE